MQDRRQFHLYAVRDPDLPGLGSNGNGAAPDAPAADAAPAEAVPVDVAPAATANGAPVPLPEEQANAEKYRERIARYRQAVQLHERNIDALKKELGNTK